LAPNWASSYGEPPAFHFLRLVSAIKAIHELGITSDLPAVREFGRIMTRCQHLHQQTELLDAINPLLTKDFNGR
jgi:hypothetical protein